MTLAPLLAASPVIQAHTLAALCALAIGALQGLCPKGTALHRRLGLLWVAVMVIVAGSSLLIHDLRVWGLWSPIHLLSILTLIGLWLGVVAARRGDLRTHARTMTALLLLALIGAGAFTLLPGRLMHQVVFG